MTVEVLLQTTSTFMWPNRKFFTVWI